MNKSELEQQASHRYGEPTAEIARLAEKSGLDLKWYAVPQLEGRTREMQSIDARSMLGELYGHKILKGAVRVFDLLNGCSWLCDTCLVDAMAPYKIVTGKSWKNLLKDRTFLEMLDPTSMRIGWTGDILNHPDGVEIVQDTLEATSEFGKHKIDLFTNFRAKSETSLDKLIEIATKNPERIHLAISLPFNVSTEVHRRFAEYLKAREGVFGYRVKDDYFHDQGGLNAAFRLKGVKNITVFDVRHEDLIWDIGRSVGIIVERKVNDSVSYIDGGGEAFVKDFNFCRVYMNADGLWLQVYVTGMESHTARIYTPLTAKNLPVLSQLAYHPTYKAPPNWPGGGGIKRYSHIQRLLPTVEMKELTKVRG